MSTKKKVFLFAISLLVVIQFFRPEKNNAEQLIGANDISKKYSIPEDVHAIVTKKCYDCHSNKTVYPWYSGIQPVAWWMNHHIDEGKDELNFSEFASYSEKRANHKMEEILEAVNDAWMPLDSYKWMHSDAAITQQDKDLINGWIKGLGLPEEDHH
jgi:hypothetical protein